MKTKLDMAHEYAMKHIQEGWDINYDVLVVDAWDYAEAMQAEAEKRSVYGANWDKEKGIQNIFVNDVEQDRTWAGEEWQPDWSQAPDWANWWVATANQSGKITGGWFYSAKPEFGFGDGPSVYYSTNGNSNLILADSFGYTGDWRNSLRKRPE